MQATPLPALALRGDHERADGADESTNCGERRRTQDEAARRPAAALSRGGLCSAIVAVARANDLPIPFFANLIWQESSFRSRTISPAGALGIAQFIPETAVEHGLMNPFEPVHALFAVGKTAAQAATSSSAISVLRRPPTTPGRSASTTGWPSAERLPGETRAYVVRITGRQADQWLSSEIAHDPEATLMPARAPCAEVAEEVKAQAKIVRVARLMSELAAATAPPRDGERAGRADTAVSADCRAEQHASASCRARADKTKVRPCRRKDCKSRAVDRRRIAASNALQRRLLVPAFLAGERHAELPGAAETRFFAPHLPQVASIRVSPCLMVTAFFSIASLISRSASARIASFDISRPVLVSTHCGNLPRSTGYSHFFHLKMMNGRIAAAIISTIANG